MRKTFVTVRWLLVGSACLMSGCALAPTPPPVRTSVFGPGQFASTASPPIPYMNLGRRSSPVQTLNSLPPGAATGVSGAF